MKMKCFFGALILSTLAFAQDPQFTQFYANPLYLNPAFAGSNNCPRVCLNYRNEWPAITGTFVTTSFSYDQYAQGMHGGLGVLVTHDKAGEGTINTTNVSGIYSYHLKIHRTVSINFGFQASYHQKSVDWDKLNYGDQIDPKKGFIHLTAEVPGTSAQNLDLSAGLLVYGDHFYGGASVSHLTTPNETVKNGFSPLPMKYNVHGGIKIPLGNDGFENYISPNLIYQEQQDFKELNIGFYAARGPIVGGMWYRGRDAFILLIGVQSGIYRMGYSYDVTVSKLSNATAGSHELSLGLYFGCKPKKKNFRPIDCPSF